LTNATRTRDEFPGSGDAVPSLTWALFPGAVLSEPEGSPLQVVRRRSDWLVLITGELDRLVAADLVDEVQRALDQDVRDVVIDLSQAVYLDGGGLHAIDVCRTRCEERGVRLRLGADLPSNVRRILALVGMEALSGPVAVVDDE
jgi:anti-anti-sigma factor